MSFVAILVALLLEQARPVHRRNPIHAGLRLWVRWASSNFDAGHAQHGWLTWFVAVMTPTAGVLLLHWLLFEFAGWPVAVVWNIAVLYLTLGFRQFSHHFTEIRDALEAGDDLRARQLLADWQQVNAGGLPKSELLRQVVEFSVIAAHRHVFGVLAWYSVLAALGLGPAGAVFYRLSEFVPRYLNHRDQKLIQPVSLALQRVSARAWQTIDWVPARITAIGFAVVGSFEEAIESWRNREQQESDDNDAVILAATAGAINLRLGPAAIRPGLASDGPPLQNATPDARAAGGFRGQEPEVGHLRTVVGLVWRSVLMWLILLALLTLARLLG